MAIRFSFSGKEHRRHNNTERQERPVNVGLTAEDVRGIVNREMNNMDTKKTIVSCFDELAATNLRTEAVLNEIKEELSSIAENGENLESAVHKDNLASYRNLKELIESSDAEERGRAESLFRIEEQNRRTWELILRTDGDNKKRFKKLKALATWAVVLGVIAVLLCIVILYFNLPVEWRFLG